MRYATPLGIYLHQTKLSFKKADPLTQQKFLRELNWIKNLSKDMMRFYEDETHIRDYQALHASWFLRGLHTAAMQTSRYLVP
ncbi:hypothetical protein BLD50_00515 [Bacillus cereus]|nr:hypothetical protein BLD50_00515 [Bacillus cereus]